MTRDGRPNSSRKSKISGANADREMFIFCVQLTTSRIGNLTRLIHTLLHVMTIHNYYTALYKHYTTPHYTALYKHYTTLRYTAPHCGCGQHFYI